MNFSREIRFAALAGLVLCAGRVSGQYLETNTGCALCHQQPQSQTDFCNTVPAAEWARDDKHRQAFFLLHETDPSDPRKGAAKRELVRRILGFEMQEAFVDETFTRLKDASDEETRNNVATVKACLRCHATWPKVDDGQFAHIPPVPLELGVSCQGCHGPGQRWLTPHFQPTWRLVTPAAKEALGHKDTRSIDAKAKLCASCHVGSVAEDKFVKHEWYAGGHPPLPSFELASFEAQMPMHWKSLNEKKKFLYRDDPANDQERLLANSQAAALQAFGIPRDGIKASYREANFPDAAANGTDPFSDLARLKDAAVGGVAVMESYVKSVGDYAAMAAEKKAAWPELALYDCTACHHELRSGLASKTRPKRSHTPGRPPLATWTNVMTLLAAAQAAGYEDAQVDMRWSDVRGQIQQLERAATSRPFGDPAAMKTAAWEAATALAKLVNDAGNTRFDEGAARKALALLTNAAEYEAADFHTARQAAWAIGGASQDVGIGSMEVLFARTSSDPLALNLPSGPNRSVIESLRRWLPAAAKYDARWFEEELKAVRAKLAIP